MKRSGSIDRLGRGRRGRQGITLTPVLWWRWGWNSVRWRECGGWWWWWRVGGGDQRDGWVWRDTQKSHKWPTVPRQQHLPRRLPPLHYPATELLLRPVHGRFKGRRGRWMYGCVCVCYITKKVFYCPHTQILARYFLLRPSSSSSCGCYLKAPIHKKNYQLLMLNI